jgi:phenylacetate-CoA ligase
MKYGVAAWMKDSTLCDQLVRCNPFYYQPVRRLLRDLRSMTIVERQAHTHELLTRVLRWAEQIHHRGYSTTDLAQWPVLEKQELRGQEARFRNPLRASTTDTTSGTSGIPLTLWRSLRCVAAEQAFFDDALQPFGFTCRGAKIARVFTEDVKPVSDRNPPFGRMQQGGRRLILSANHMNADAVWWYVDALEQFRPDLLWGMTNALLFLGHHMVKQNRRLSIPVVLPTAEILYPSGRALLEQAFGGCVLEQYGSAERVFFATSAVSGQFYFQPAYGHVELKPVPRDESDGHRCAELIATGFWNEAMPLVRYRVQDHILFPREYTQDDLRDVALGCKPFMAVEGRSSEYLISDGGTFLEGMGSIAAGLPDVLQVQVVQERLEQVLIRVLPMSGFSDASRGAMLRNARRKIPLSMQVLIEVVDALEQLPSGKIPKVIRRLPDGVAPALQRPPSVVSP